MADAKTEKQKVKEITDKLEEGLKELFESEKYKSYLSTMSKFHNYSFNNTLLINLQRPGATFVRVAYDKLNIASVEGEPENWGTPGWGTC